MTPILRLGLKLTVAGRSALLRSLSTCVGSAIAAATLLGTLAVASDHVLAVTSGEPLSATFRLFAVLVVVVSLPVIVLVTVVSRLSATVRDRRLAALRLLGLSPRQTRGVAAVEVAVMSVIGTFVGATASVAVLLPVLATASVAGMPLIAESTGPGATLVIPVLLGVPVVTVLVSQAAMRSVSASPLAVAHRSSSRRLRRTRLIPLAAGISLTGWSTTWPQSREVVSATFQFAVSVSGILLNLVGLVLAVPLLVSGGAWLLARATRRPASLVAARRLQMEPAATTRLATGLLVGLFVISGAQCVVVAFEQTSGYREELEDVLADPQVLMLGADRDATGSGSFARAVEERGLGRTSTVQVLLSPEDAEPYRTALVASCRLLYQALPGLRECSDTAPAWIYPPERTGSAPVVLASGGTSPQGTESPTLSLPPPPRILDWDRTPVTEPTPLAADLFVPKGYRNAESVVAASPYVQWAVTTEPGLRASARVYRLHDRYFPGIDNPWQRETVRMVHGMRVIVWTVASVVVLIGLAAFLVAAVDRAVERRRENASLQVLGAPPAVIRSAQLQQILVPLLFGIPSAVALGLLSGAALLAYGSALEATPLASISLTGLTATAIAGAAGLLTSLGLTRPLEPELLRRE